MPDFCTETEPAVEHPHKQAPLPTAPHLPPWASLLEWFYRRAGFDLPRVKELKGDRVPDPYKRLLVHSSDMTPTLENFFQQPLGLSVISRELHDETYLREVVLTLGPERRRIIYGVIRIFLNHFPIMARRRVYEERFPLGHILQTEQVPHLSWPQAFFRVEPDLHMVAMLGLPQARALYGRRNVLLDASRRLLAEVIEVLGPVAADEEQSKDPATGSAGNTGSASILAGDSASSTPSVPPLPRP